MHFVQQVRRCTREICYHSPPVFTLSRVLNVSESRSRKIASIDEHPRFVAITYSCQASRENRNVPILKFKMGRWIFYLFLVRTRREKKKKRRRKMRFPLFFFQLYGWCATPRHNRESSEENRINLTARYNQHERKFTFLVLFVSLPLSFLQPVFPRLRLFSSTYSSSPLLDIILSPKNFTKKKKKKKKRIEKGASFEPTTRHYFFRWGQRSNQCVNCSRCGSWDVFFLSLSPSTGWPMHFVGGAYTVEKAITRGI